MALLTKDDILKANDLTKELVKVPEWGGEVYVFALTGTERDKFEMAIVKKNTKKVEVNIENIRATLAVMSIRDENGIQLFTLEDVKALGNKSCAALQRIYDVATRISRLSKDDVEELAKN